MSGSRLSPILALVAVVLCAGHACAYPADKQAGQCFLSRNVNNFTAPDDHTVYVRVGVNEIYRLDLMTDCIDIPFRQSLGLESMPGNPWICSPLDATIVTRDTGIPQRCPVKAIQKLTPDQVTALPKRDRP